MIHVVIEDVDRQGEVGYVYADDNFLAFLCLDGHGSLPKETRHVEENHRHRPMQRIPI